MVNVALKVQTQVLPDSVGVGLWNCFFELLPQPKVGRNNIAPQGLAQLLVFS
jgi:hypothetical protein